jgi:surface protein
VGLFLVEGGWLGGEPSTMATFWDAPRYIRYKKKTMRKEHWLHNHRNSEISQQELERKWRVLQEQEEMQRLWEEMQQGRQASPSAGPGGGGGGILQGGTSPFFIIQVDTTLGDGLDQFTVPTDGNFSYNYDVAWQEVGNPGNAGALSGQTGDATLSFPSPGNYRISISGLFPAIFFNEDIDCQKLVDILQWGTNPWQSMEVAFYGCSNLSTYTATDAPDLSLCTSMFGMFQLAASFNGDLSSWNTASITNMSEMFKNSTAFNGDISTWDTSSVTEMNNMFQEATSFDGDISGWDTSSVTGMYSMFQGATAFNGDLSAWDTTSVTSMGAMFYGCSSFNGDISGWNTASVTAMNYMFFEATLFDQPISTWDTSSVTDMVYMFQDATAFNQDLSGWCVSLIPSLPTNFDTGATAWVLPSSRPVWGNCP